jgi:hypothetical protein
VEHRLRSKEEFTMDGNDLQRCMGPRSAGKATRASLAALRQRQQPTTVGTAADCLKVSRLQELSRPEHEKAATERMQSGRRR